MRVPYEYTSTRLINQLHAKASLKPYSLIDCDDFSNWGKLGLIVTIALYILSPIIILTIRYQHNALITHETVLLLIFALIVNVWVLRCAVDYFLKLYKQNLENAFKNMPSPLKLFRVIKGLLKFAKEKGVSQGELCSYLYEELASEVKCKKTTIEKWFAIANKINKL